VAFYLGIDGGGSKTTCAVGDETSLLSKTTAGPSNITRVGEACARESLHAAVSKACAAAQIDPQQVQRACIGAAGAGRQEVATSIRRIARELISGEVEVVADMPIALEAAFGSEPGVIVIAGTGSFAYGRNAQGRTARAGGWGFAISDEGSAHWIGRAAVTALLRAIDEEKDEGATEASRLFREVKAALKVNTLDEFVRTANSGADFPALFRAVLLAEQSGDSIARQILAQAGTELARFAGIVVHHLFPDDEAGPFVPLAVAGGVFRHSTLVRQTFIDETSKFDRRITMSQQIVEPVLGALQRARRSALPK
jgi:N-acetylglucosamine kinase-like BadF-type ATPase